MGLKMSGIDCVEAISLCSLCLFASYESQLVIHKFKNGMISMKEL